MKTENKQTLEQKAFASYSSKIMGKNMNKIARNFAFITAGLAIFTFCIYNTGSHLWLSWTNLTVGIISIFILLVIGFFAGGSFYILFFIFASWYYWSDSYSKKIASLLSEEAKKTIICEYIDEQITLQSKNFTYYQNIADENKKSAEICKQKYYELLKKRQSVKIYDPID